jgi:hypothetical protein
MTRLSDWQPCFVFGRTGVQVSDKTAYLHMFVAFLSRSRQTPEQRIKVYHGRTLLHRVEAVSQLSQGRKTEVLWRVQSLLCNRRIDKGVMQPVSRQRIGKQVPAATSTNRTIELLLDTVFSTESVQTGYKEDNSGDPVSTLVWRRVRIPPP